MKKMKIIIAALIPIIIGMSGFYVFTENLLSVNLNVWGNGIVSAYYTICYIIGFMPCVIVVGIFSLVYVLPLIHQLKYKIGIIFLFLFYLLLLVIIPHIIHIYYYKYHQFLPPCIQKKWVQQCEINEL